MKTIKCVGGIAASVVITLWSSSVNAQVDPLSDTLFETILGNGVTINSPQTYQIFESQETGQPILFTVPALTVDFFENSTSQQRSDRFHFDAYNVTITSDAESPLASRPGAILANEAFQIMSIRAISDGEDPFGN